MIWAPKGDKSQQKSDLGLVSSIDDVGDAKIHVEMAEVGDICSCRMAAKSGYERCGPSQAQKKKNAQKNKAVKRVHCLVRFQPFNVFGNRGIHMLNPPLPLVKSYIAPPSLKSC